MPVTDLSKLIGSYKTDPESVYNIWFIESEARMKAFRAIRRGVIDVIGTIKAGTFGNDFKDSPLEFVLNCITEQKQVFSGAAHPFYWKPKLRIPDIYENEQNKRKFGQFLEAALSAGKEEHLISEILRLDLCCIKGLGPAVANILYFLHPTWMPPFNTAIVRGFNILFGDSRKLGCWKSYLAMREAIINLNKKLSPLLSKDLGAISGLLYEIGSGRFNLQQPGLELEAGERLRQEKIMIRRHQEILQETQENNEHLQVQILLVEIGRELGYDVFVAVNDRTRYIGEKRLEFLTLPGLPNLGLSEETTRTVSMIDVIWFNRACGRVACAFEIEKTTSIFSGMLRLADLAASLGGEIWDFFLVVPDQRENEVLRQMERPSLRSLANMRLRYLRFSDLRKHRHAIATFGDDYRILFKVAGNHQFSRELSDLK